MRGFMIKRLLDELKIPKYPQNLGDFYEKVPPVSILDKENLMRIEERFSPFGDFIPQMLEAIDKISEERALLKYADLALSYLYECDGDDAAMLAMPDIKENSVLRFFPALILAALLPRGIAEYERRGFSEAEIFENLHGTFGARIAMSEKLCGLMGLDSSGFSWLRLYCYAKVFRAGSFNVTPKNLPDKIIVLRNKDTSELALVMCDGEFHRSGKALGNKEYTDTVGAFSANFYETDSEYIGNAVVDSAVSSTPTVYEKSKWEILLQSGDAVAGIHIPRGADLSPLVMKESFAKSLEMTRERYPEFKARALHCSTWMLDPQLKEMLPPASRLVGFVDSFMKFPKRCPGNAVFTFVFDGRPTDLHDLPEDTTLRKKIKARYLSGGEINVHGGVMFID